MSGGERDEKQTGNIMQWPKNYRKGGGVGGWRGGAGVRDREECDKCLK